MSEYWVTTEPELIYCDGDADVSVPNHEMVVRQSLLSQLHAAMQQSDEPSIVDLAESLEDAAFDATIIRHIQDYVDLESWEVRGALGCDDVDVRGQAIQEWRWIRITGDNVQMHELNRQQLRLLSVALWDAYDESVEAMRFNIETSKDYFTDVSWAAIETCDVSFIARQNVGN